MFREMHATLYTDQHVLDGSHLIRYAIALGLDPTSFRRALHGRFYEKRVRENFLGRVWSGMNGTPIFSSTESATTALPTSHRRSARTK